MSNDQERATMKLTYISTALHLHRVHLADEFSRILGKDFNYIISEPPDGKYHVINDRDYLVRMYESTSSFDKAMVLLDESDVVVGGGVPFHLLEPRVSSNKLTFLSNERWLKKRLNLLNYHRWPTWMKYRKYRDKRFYLLCCSAFGPNDAQLLGCFPDKCYKWGYFTVFEDFDVEASLDVSTSGTAHLLWCARFLTLKHPDLPIRLLKKLLEEGYDVDLDMLGEGPERKKTERLAEKLGVSTYVRFHGDVPNDDVLHAMRTHDIFLFTSDRNEGWGAVSNEAMSNGCAVVASDTIGSTPFLIKDGENGMVFQSENLASLTEKVRWLIDHPEERKQMALNGYKTIRDVWSPANAARKLMVLSDAFLNNCRSAIIDGPCSIAEYL